MAQQTAVEWLVKKLKLEGYDYTVQQAKVMEKEQIINAANQNVFVGNKVLTKGENYYNETYNK